MRRTQNFYPRPPRGGRRMHASSPCSRSYFYPRPPRGGRPPPPLCGLVGVKISIHALREEGDLRPPHRPRCQFISIHALREEGDRTSASPTSASTAFLSTPSARRATDTKAAFAPSHEFLSTPSARRATAKTETKSLFSNKLYNILHEFRRALIYNGSKSYPNHAK